MNSCLCPHWISFLILIKHLFFIFSLRECFVVTNPPWRGNFRTSNFVPDKWLARTLQTLHVEHQWRVFLFRLLISSRYHIVTVSGKNKSLARFAETFSFLFKSFVISLQFLPHHCCCILPPFLLFYPCFQQKRKWDVVLDTNHSRKLQRLPTKDRDVFSLRDVNDA